ncbi:MAG: 5-dehydro-2-deoxygluconokinase, partial [Chloroflexota bacterium]
MSYDLITIGRVSMDLFSLQIGAPFVQIESFDTGVGGSPINIAIGSSRLGLKTAVLTAVGADPVGDFVLNFLQNENIDTSLVPRKPDARTGMAVLGIEPPDQFPLVFYRENPADVHLSLDDVMAAPIAESRALLLSGTALSRGSARDVTLYAADVASNAEATVFIDLDVRPDQWAHPLAYGLNVRTIFPMADVIIGTEEEFYAALSGTPERVMVKPLAGVVPDELDAALSALVERQPGTVLVVKRGARGVSIFHDGTVEDIPGFPVEIVNTVGAGDAFASGLITARLQGDDWYAAGRFANACGALV